jgi:hypothetical protein
LINVIFQKTPFEAWCNKKTNVNHVHIFGCIAHVHTPKKVRQKLDSKSYESVLMGFGEHVKGYRVYNKKTQNTFFIHGVIFYEYLVLV